MNTSVSMVEEDQGELIGFVAGRIRTLPPYFGSAVIGAIITRVELQAVAGNPDGIRLYRRPGWHEELVQMVWDTNGQTDPPPSQLNGSHGL